MFCCRIKHTAGYIISGHSGLKEHIRQTRAEDYNDKRMFSFPRRVVFFLNIMQTAFDTSHFPCMQWNLKM